MPNESNLVFVQKGAYPMTIQVDLEKGKMVRTGVPGTGYLSPLQLKDIQDEIRITPYHDESIIREGSLHFSEIRCGGRFIAPSNMTKTYNYLMTTVIA